MRATYGETRKQSYGYHEKYYSFVFKWPWYSYRRFKAYLYMELAAIAAYISMALGITPNILTLCYVLLSVLSAILLAVPSKTAVMAAAVIIFLKPTLDWADGLVARITNKTSLDGDIFDNYSALASWIFLWSGVGLYLGNTCCHVFYYISVIPPSLYAADLYANARERFLYHYFAKPQNRRPAEKAAPQSANKVVADNGFLRKVKDTVDKVFEFNARTVDIVCFMLLGEALTGFHFLWVFYSAFVIWRSLVFFIRLAAIYRGGWAEPEMNDLKGVIYGDDAKTG